jgi:hypothetical protein
VSGRPGGRTLLPTQLRHQPAGKVAPTVAVTSDTLYDATIIGALESSARACIVLMDALLPASLKTKTKLPQTMKQVYALANLTDDGANASDQRSVFPRKTALQKESKRGFVHK